MFSQRGVHPKTLAATILFRLPVIREIALATGCLDARKSVAEAILRSGHSILVLPGGEAEQIRTQYGKEIIYLKNRKGFIKLALRHGVPVVPMYAFGVSDYYYTTDMWLAPRMWLMKQFQICLPLAVGMWKSPFCPLPQTTTIVFGEPLTFKSKIVISGDDARASTDDEQLDAAHREFMDALIKLFDTHKERLGYGDRTLEIV
jgi:2-acylglycerol O-acyltransferase 2